MFGADHTTSCGKYLLNEKPPVKKTERYELSNEKPPIRKRARKELGSQTSSVDVITNSIDQSSTPSVLPFDEIECNMNHDDECISSIDGNVAMPMNDVSTYPISFGSEEEFLLSNEKYLGETEDFSLPVEASLILDLNGGWERLNRHRSNSDAISCLWMSDRECV